MIGQTTNESQNINVIDSKEIDVNINKKIIKNHARLNRIQQLAICEMLATLFHQRVKT